MIFNFLYFLFYHYFQADLYLWIKYFKTRFLVCNGYLFPFATSLTVHRKLYMYIFRTQTTYVTSSPEPLFGYPGFSSPGKALAIVLHFPQKKPWQSIYFAMKETLAIIFHSLEKGYSIHWVA